MKRITIIGRAAGGTLRLVNLLGLADGRRPMGFELTTCHKSSRHCRTARY